MGISYEGKMSNKTKLICLPHAGGMTSSYWQWTGYISEDIELVPMELAGRGIRFKDPFYADMREAIEDLYQKLTKEVRNDDYVIFGHSMGSTLAYELALKIERAKFFLPKHIIFSGKEPICSKVETGGFDIGNDNAILDELTRMGGMPQKLLENKEIMQMFLPIIKADLHMLNEYACKSLIPLEVPISIFYGMQDEYVAEGKIMLGWKVYSTISCDFYQFNGRHFYLFEDIANVVNTITRIVQPGRQK